MVWFGYIIENILHKSDEDDYDNNNGNNNSGKLRQNKIS